MARLLSAVLLALLFVSAKSASAKRAAPNPVPPVEYKGINYSAPNHDGRTAYVLASDSSGKELFRVKVFEVPIDPKLEEDVQWVFITALKLSRESLLVKDERGRCYAVDLPTRVVRRKYWCRF